MPVISVLWGIGLLTMLSVSLLWSGNISYQLARNGFEIASIDAVAEAVINRAILGLSDQRGDRLWRTDGVARNFDFDRNRVRVVVQDELGRIDLNHADTGLLDGLLQSAGVAPQSASAMADKIQDWRDPGALKRVNGGKEQDYRLAGLAYGPRNGPFQSVEELALVMDMTPALFKRIEPALTVYSGRQFIDPQVAPREALMALPGMDAAKVDSVIAARLNQPYGASNGPPVARSPNSLQGRAFTIRAEISRPTGVVVREAAIRLTDNPVQPYLVLNWKAEAGSR